MYDDNQFPLVPQTLRILSLNFYLAANVNLVELMNNFCN